MIKVSMLKIYIKGKVFITTKDILFIIASLVMLLFILDAFAEQPRIGTYFLYVLIFFDYIYLLKMIDNYNLQKIKQPDQQPVLEDRKLEARNETTKPVKATKTRFFES